MKREGQVFLCIVMSSNDNYVWFVFQSYIKCKHVDYLSSRTEPFYDIQLNIKGKKTSKYITLDVIFIYLILCYLLNSLFDNSGKIKCCK